MTWATEITSLTITSLAEDVVAGHKAVAAEGTSASGVARRDISPTTVLVVRTSGEEEVAVEEGLVGAHGQGEAPARRRQLWMISGRGSLWQISCLWRHLFLVDQMYTRFTFVERSSIPRALPPSHHTPDEPLFTTGGDVKPYDYPNVEVGSGY
jgi:hypothetical protein